MSLALMESFTPGAMLRPCGTPPSVDRERMDTEDPAGSITVLSMGATPGGKLSRDRVAPEKPDIAVSPGARPVANSARPGTAKVAARTASSANARQPRILGCDLRERLSLWREAPQLDGSTDSIIPNPINSVRH